MRIAVIGGGPIGQYTYNELKQGAKTHELIIWDASPELCRPKQLTYKYTALSTIAFICVPTVIINTERILVNVVLSLRNLNPSIIIVIRSPVYPGRCKKLEACYMPIIGDEYGEELTSASLNYWQIGMDLNNSVHTKYILDLLLKLFTIYDNQVEILDTVKLEELKWGSNIYDEGPKKRKINFRVPHVSKEVIKNLLVKIKQYRNAL